jgi:hypothetical protein
MNIYFLSQRIKYEGTTEAGSLPQIHLSITTPQARLTTKAPPYGSLKAMHSWTGKHPGYCRGFMESVQSPGLYSFPLANGPPFPQQDPGKVSRGLSLPYSYSYIILTIHQLIDIEGISSAGYAHIAYPSTLETTESRISAPYFLPLLSS